MNALRCDVSVCLYGFVKGKKKGSRFCSQMRLRLFVCPCVYVPLSLQLSLHSCLAAYFGHKMSGFCPGKTVKKSCAWYTHIHTYTSLQLKIV